jgi:NRAMP (natural resistance-associated macrophage protein)-like metal ion transporter
MYSLKLKRAWQRLARIIGPGLITGAADDDPSGIATYSQSGARYGYGMLWSAFYQLPLLIAIQEACARIGAVTGRGLAGVVRKYYSKKILFFVVTLVVIANVINLGADFGAIIAATKLIINLPAAVIAIVAAIFVICLEVFVSYKKYARLLKWLTLALLAYPLTALLLDFSWSEVLTKTILPHIQFNFEFLFLVTGIFGTTISPYMFFWQASEEVEEELDKGIINHQGQKPDLKPRFIKNMRLDNAIGMVFSNLIQWFIILVTATVLFKNGVLNINTAADAAKAIEPLVSAFPYAGLLAKSLFAIGIIGIALVGIPVLAGSASYALSEAMNWKEGLYRKFNQAKGFYYVIIIATLLGLLINFSGIDPIKALIFTAVFNGLAAVPLIFIIARINRNEKILGQFCGGWLSNIFIWLTFIVMFGSALGLFYTLAQR